MAIVIVNGVKMKRGHTTQSVAIARKNGGWKMNKVSLIGRLTRDPDIRYTQSVNPVAVVNFGLAVNRRFKREGEPDADFINCVAFSKTGELVQKYCAKGRQVGIVGRLQIDPYEKDGEKRTAAKIIVEEITFCGSSDGVVQQGQPQQHGFAPIPPNEDEDLPF